VFERFSRQARHVVVLAQEESRRLGHSYIGTEHLLLGVLRAGQSVALDALERLGVQPAQVRSAVEATVGRGGDAPPGHIPFTADAKRALEMSLREALELGDNYIGTEHVLLGLVRDGESVAARVLAMVGADRDRLRPVVLDLLRHGESRERALGLGAPTPERLAPARLASTPPVCVLCGRDLWEVGRYVRGEAGAVCDECISTSVQTLKESSDDRRAVTLPPRLYGFEGVDPAIPEAITERFQRAFATGAPQEAARVIEDGDAIQPFMALAGERSPHIRPTGVHVNRIRFTDKNHAEVRFTLELAGGPDGITFDGTAIRQQDRWLVSRETVGQMLAPVGVRLPPVE
jgi:Clp amino terminal domain, pathogenicity island component/ClpX C4-type zinc finger